MMCISYKCFAFIKNILSFIANKHIYTLVSFSFLHSEGDIPIFQLDVYAMVDYCSTRTRMRAHTFSELVIAHRINQQVTIWKEASSMIKLLLLDLWRTVPEIHCT
jgi:hypothetical protein